MPVFYHRTAASAEILRDGFVDGVGSYGFVDFTFVGVFISDEPLDVNEGTTGEDLLAVTLPDEVDVDDFELVSEDPDLQGYREWCVPSALLNTYATVRLMSQEEGDAISNELWQRRLGRSGQQDSR